MGIDINIIKEIYKGHYQVILKPIRTCDLVGIIDPSYKYVWGFDHKESLYEWSAYADKLFGRQYDENILKVRNINMEFLMETSAFLKSLPTIRGGVKIIQTNEAPPYYLDIHSLTGKSKYDLLKSKVDYLFEIDLPGSPDYTEIVSSQSEFLQNVIAKFAK